MEGKLGGKRLHGQPLYHERLTMQPFSPELTSLIVVFAPCFPRAFGPQYTQSWGHPLAGHSQGTH
jgi:hypothetical protein